MMKGILLLCLLAAAVCLNLQPKTSQSFIASFSKYDVNSDGLLSKRELKKYFDEDYMHDFKGIDIDPRFLDSAYNYLQGHDKEGDGLDQEEFLKAVTPQEDSAIKREPSHYHEQDL